MVDNNNFDNLHELLIKSSGRERRLILDRIENIIIKNQEITRKYAELYNKFNFQKSIVDIIHNKSNNLKEKKNKITSDIESISLPNLSYLPNTTVYWIEDIKQHAIKINGIIFRGGIGNIYPVSGKNVKNVKNCKNGKNCRKILKGKCNFYHDPIEFVGLDEINPIRNYTQSSWIYTNQSDNPKNKYMRRVGNFSTLEQDLMLFNNRDDYNEIKNIYLSQTFHDILVSLSI